MQVLVYDDPVELLAVCLSQLLSYGHQKAGDWVKANEVGASLSLGIINSLILDIKMYGDENPFLAQLVDTSKYATFGLFLGFFIGKKFHKVLIHRLSCCFPVSAFFLYFGEKEWDWSVDDNSV